MSKSLVDELIKSIGYTNSRKVRFVLDRLRSLPERSHNCASFSLYLLGDDESIRNAYLSPIHGLWANHANLIFLYKDQSRGYFILKAIDKEEELNEKAGYIPYKRQDGYFPMDFKLAFRPGKIYYPGQLFRESKNKNSKLDFFVDPVNQIKGRNELWERLTKMLDEFEVISEVTYRVRPYDYIMNLGEFHQSILLTNGEEYFCIEKEFDAVTFTKINKRNIRETLSPTERGLHLFAEVDI